MRPRDFLLSLILPGTGQIACGRPVRGILLCVAFTAAAAVAATRAAFLPGSVVLDVPFLLALGLMAAAWLLAQWGMLLRLRQHSLRPCLHPARDRHFERGVIFYLRADLVAAEHEFRRALLLDPEDADAWFYLAAVLEELGEVRRAQRARAHCRAVDVQGKWLRVSPKCEEAT